MFTPVKGGQFLRTRRRELGLTIEDAIREMRHQNFLVSDVSRIETGRLASPGLHKVITYGIYLGFTPNRICQAYGLWDDPQGPPDELVYLMADVRRLPDTDREAITNVIRKLVRP